MRRAALLALAGVGLSCADLDSSAQVRFAELRLSLLSEATALVGRQARLRAAVFSTSGGLAPLVRSFSWSVIAESTGELLNASDAGAEYAFAPSVAGPHRVECIARLYDDRSLFDTITLQVRKPQQTPRRFVARVVPPPSSGLPPVDQHFTVAGADLSGLEWRLAAATDIELFVTDGSRRPLESFVQILADPTDPDPRRLVAPGGRVRFALMRQRFSALVIPSNASGVAPLALVDLEAGAVQPSWRVEIDDPGQSVSGAVWRGEQPLVGAMVMLRTRSTDIAPELPSTRAVTDQQGRFALRCRPGVATLIVVPPQDSRLPVAVVQSATLQVEGSAAAEDWSFVYDDHTAVPLAAVVRVDPEDSRPLAGARVELSGRMTQAPGTLQTAAGTFPASGFVTAQLESDAAGRLVDRARGAAPELPAGEYQVEIVPPPGANLGRRVIDELRVDGLAEIVLAPAEIVSVRGVVRDAADNPVSARVTLRNDEGAQVVSTSRGAFSARVAAGTRYDLSAQPAVRQLSLGRLLLRDVLIAGATDLEQLKLPEAWAVSGRLVTAGGAGIPDALIRVYCDDSDCARASIVDQAQGDAQGHFTIYVPREDDE